MTEPALSPEAALDDEGTTRAAFLARAALVTGAVLGAGAAGPLVRSALAQEARGDLDILNFLLSMHRIELGLYEQAQREVTDASREVDRLIDTFVDHEREHVRVMERLVRLLGGRVAEPPALDFGSRLRTERSFMLLAMEIEDVVLQAGQDAAREVTSKDALAEVAKVLQIEARHSTALATRIGKPAVPTAFEGTLSRDQARQELRPFVV